MHWAARLLAACVVGVIAGALMVWATGYVLVHALGLNDPGIGGGLFCLVAAPAVAVGGGVVVFRALPRPARD